MKFCGTELNLSKGSGANSVPLVNPEKLLADYLSLNRRKMAQQLLGSFFGCFKLTFNLFCRVSRRDALLLSVSRNDKAIAPLTASQLQEQRKSLLGNFWKQKVDPQTLGSFVEARLGRSILVWSTERKVLECEGNIFLAHLPNPSSRLC